MAFPSENETWIIDAGCEVIEKRSIQGMDSLSDREKLIYCLWVADYGIRNAGDLETARELYPPFQEEGAALASKLSLEFIAESFSIPGLLERDYYDRFERICDDLRKS